MQLLLLTLFQPDLVTGQQLKMFSRILWHSWEMFVYCCINYFNSNLHQLQCKIYIIEKSRDILACCSGIMVRQADTISKI